MRYIYDPPKSPLKRGTFCYISPLNKLCLPITLETLVGRRGAGSKGERRKNHSS